LIGDGAFITAQYSTRGATAASDFQPYRAHQLERVALASDAGAEQVVEGDPAVFDVILEVHVGAARGERVGDVRQGQVVGSEQADGALSDEVADKGLGADGAVAGVGLVE
jgi:hypothetical protein